MSHRPSAVEESLSGLFVNFLQIFARDRFFGTGVDQTVVRFCRVNYWIAALAGISKCHGERGLTATTSEERSHVLHPNVSAPGEPGGV